MSKILTYFNKILKIFVNLLDNTQIKRYYDVKKLDKKEVNMKIKAFRESKNLTQDEFAKKVRVSRTTVTMWENEKSNPSAKKLKEIAEIFNCKVDDLL